MHGTCIKIIEALQYKISWGRGGGNRSAFVGSLQVGRHNTEKLRAAFLQH